MRVFILVRKDDDYSSLPPNAQKIFIFDTVSNNPVLSDTINTLNLIFESAEPGDRIVFNGPSWLIAIAGYCWLNQERDCMGILLYDNKNRTYQEHNDAY